MTRSTPEVYPIARLRRLVESVDERTEPDDPFRPELDALAVDLTLLGAVVAAAIDWRDERRRHNWGNINLTMAQADLLSALDALDRAEESR